ncbi:hypothetical protein [Campylobacter sp. RM16190]|uniref:hypothetical protein n=1 Tax=Campylobacter sp. RM16190 TaxID=1705727 RepID=UPI001473C5B5|nr:hypothetical protein [Campylobacter sp. RM16190]
MANFNKSFFYYRLDKDEQEYQKELHDSRQEMKRERQEQERIGALNHIANIRARITAKTSYKGLNNER